MYAPIWRLMRNVLLEKGTFLAFVTLVAGGFSFVSNAAESISVPNASFESPATVFVDTRIDSWQETPKPFWYDESGGYTWDQLTGVFFNNPPPSADHIENCDGLQAMYLFAVPQNGIFQHYESTDWAHPTPMHSFNAKFEVGKSYELKTGVIGGLGGMAEGVALQLGLYYLDASSNQVMVGTTYVPYYVTNFSGATNFVDFTVKVPGVRSTDAWAGKNIGIAILSAVGFESAGGYWDVDNVRLTAKQEPILSAPAIQNNQVVLTLKSEPALRFEILSNTNVAIGTWTTIGMVTNGTGTVSFTNATPNASAAFYQLRQVP